MSLHPLEDEEGGLAGNAFAVNVVARLLYGFLWGVSGLKFKGGPGNFSRLRKQWEAWDALEGGAFEASRGTWAQQHTRMVLTPCIPGFGRRG